jgi:pimeloyl-ACP methyl ester carboxylesterase
MFTPSHRGGSGQPLVCLHGFMDTWRVWELVLAALERRHDVLALTLAGHAGGPQIEGAVSEAAVIDAVERAMDDARDRAADPRLHRPLRRSAYATTIRLSPLWEVASQHARRRSPRRRG